MRVFCEQCRFMKGCRAYPKDWPEYTDCYEPDNIINTYDWYGVLLKFKRKPQEINRDNDCPNFISKEPNGKVYNETTT